MRFLGAAFAVTLSLCTGCLPDDPESPYTICEEQAELTCQFLFDCCTVDERETSFIDGQTDLTTREVCIEENTRICKNRWIAEGSTRSIGSLDVRVKRARACLDKAQESADNCHVDAWENEYGFCSRFLTEEFVDEGSVCISTANCAEGQQCLHWYDALPYDIYSNPKREEYDSAYAYCQIPAQLGERCFEPKNHCDVDLVCQQGTCQKSRGLDQPCEEFQNHCVAGTRCELVVDYPSSERRCRAWPSWDDRCDGI